MIESFKDPASEDCQSVSKVAGVCTARDIGGKQLTLQGGFADMGRDFRKL